MFGSLAKPFFTAFFVVVSSAACDYDAEETPQVLKFCEDDLVTAENMVNVDRDYQFIGDLRLGRRRSGESTYNKVWGITNSRSEAHTEHFQYTVPRGTVHYLSVSSVGGTNAAICPIHHILGSRTARFSVRMRPHSAVTLNLFVSSS